MLEEQYQLCMDLQGTRDLVIYPNEAIGATKTSNDPFSLDSSLAVMLFLLSWTKPPISSTVTISPNPFLRTWASLEGQMLSTKSWNLRPVI